MTTTYFNLESGNFSQDWSNINLITSDDNWSGVPSIMGYLGDIDAGSTSGVDPRTLTGANLGAVDVIANQTNPNTLTNGGVAEFQGIANPTIALNGSGTADAPSIVIYLDATGRENLVFNATIRDIDGSADNTNQQVNVQYRIGETGSWTNVVGGYIADASTGPSLAVLETPLSLALPSDVNGQSQVQIRILTSNAPSSDEWVGVDNIVVASEAANAGGAGAFSIADVAVLEGDAGTSAMVFTVSRTGGSTGAVSVDYTVTLPGGLGGADLADFDSPVLSGTVSFADQETSATITLNVTGDVVVEPSETFSITLSNAIGGATISDGTGVGTITNDDFSVTKIHDVQGTAFFSPIVAAEGIQSYNVATAGTVTVSAVVTAIDSFGALQGFYIQEEVADWDADNRTSEGIFVRTTSPVAGLTVGETVTVTAKVMEFQDFSNLNRTMLVTPTSIVQGNDSVALPTLVLDGSAGRKIPNQIISDDNPNFFDSVDDPSDTFDPENDALDFYETIEGMRVTVPSMVVGDGFVGGSNDNFVFFNAYSTVHADASLINSRGGYTISGDPQFYPVNTPGTGDDVIEGGRHLTDGAIHGDMLELDFGNVGRGGASSFDQLLTMGDQLGDVTGILDFDFGVTKLYVTDALDPTAVANLGGNPTREVTTLAHDDRALRVATFNVENLSPVGTTYDERGGPKITAQEKFDGIAADIANNLKAPDIIIIQEVQDNNGVNATGGADASTTWSELVAAVNLATGKTYSWVDETPEGSVGGAPGGNIRVGFLYNTARVQLGDLDANATIEERRAYTDRIGDGVRTAGDLIAFDDSMLGNEINSSQWEGTRRSIVGEFNFNGNAVYVFGSHLPSKGGSGEPFQINQNIATGNPANGDWQLRTSLGQDLWAMQNLVSASDPDARVVGGGDFNEFWFYRPLEAITGYVDENGVARTSGTQYVNLMVQELQPQERFSYDFDGRSQALDTLISDQQLGAVADFDVVHINTGYNDRNGAVNPATSDHDPSLARFDFRNFAETLNGTSGNDTVNGFGGDDILAGNQGNDELQGGAGNDIINGDAGNDKLFGNAGNDVINGGDGNDRIVGSTGNDQLNGGAGDDAFGFRGVGTSDGFDVIDGGTGFDTIRTEVAGANIALESFVGIERISAGGFPPVSVVGSDNANVFDFTGVQMVGIGSINMRGGNDTVIGSSGNDTILGGAGTDTINGAGGNDVITGNNDADILTGGDGSDTFNYDAIWESRFGVNADTITDFTTGVDFIDLAGIDANTLVAGDQAFAFIGQAAFTGVAGQLRIDTSVVGQTQIFGDVNGNGTADLHIILTNAAITSAADYIL